MDDVQEFINKILSDAKLAQSKNFTSGVYRDEPILKTAAQIAYNAPPEYREMRKIAKGYDVFNQSGPKVFYKQGKFMENFEDDFDFHGDFVRYFPTYQTMNDMQLRGYFSWRTKVRKGHIEKTALSFVFVYIYELLNQIGVSSPENGFHTLKSFWGAYREMDNQINHYVKLWLKDYVVYNNLDKSLLEDVADVNFDDEVLTLLDYPSHGADDVFAALNSLSSYHLDNSKLFKQFPEDVKQVICNAFTALAEYYDKKRKNGLCEKFFGRIYTDHYTMFRSAVFYHQHLRKDFVYEFNDICKYRCKNGNWSCERIFYYSGKNQQIGAMLKTVDFLMRQRYGFKSTLKAGKTTKLMAGIIEKEIDKYLETKRRNALPKVEIDVSKLHHIRRTSLETQNKLLVEDDGDEAAAPEAAVEAPAEEYESGLSSVEYRLLYCLLYGRAYDELIRSGGLMLSVLVDAINEKLFGRFGDTVIVFDGDKPEFIEEYIEELKGIIPE